GSARCPANGGARTPAEADRHPSVRVARRRRGIDDVAQVRRWPGLRCESALGSAVPAPYAGAVGRPRTDRAPLIGAERGEGQAAPADRGFGALDVPGEEFHQPTVLALG